MDEQEAEFRFESCVCKEYPEQGESSKDNGVVDLNEKRCYCGGLTEEQVRTLEMVKETERKSRYVRKNVAVLLFHAFWNFTSWLVELSCICSISINKHQVAPPSWQEFLIIFVGLLLLLGFSSLAEHFFTKLWPNLNLDWCIEVIRNSGWICADEETLVPGDVICLRKGDVFPAETLVLRTKNAILCTILENRRVEIFTTSPQRRIAPKTSVLSGEVIGCISSLAVKEDRGDYTDTLPCGLNGFHSIVSSLFVPVEVSLLCFAAIFATLEIVIMFAVQHRTHETVVLDVLILLFLGTPWYLFFVVALAVLFFAYQVSSYNGPVLKKVRSIVDLSNVDKVLFGIEGTVTCQNPPCVESEVYAVEPFTSEQVLSAYRKVVSPEMMIEQEDGESRLISCERPGYQSVMITDANGNRRSFFIGDISAMKSMCALSNAELATIEDIVKSFAEKRLYPVAVARSSDHSSLWNDSDSSPDIHKRRPLSFMGLVPLNYCPSEEAKQLVEVLKSLNISVKLAGYSQKYLVEKICEDFGLDVNEAIYDAPLYPSSALLNAESLENASNDEIDIQSAIREELKESLDAPLLERTAVLSCTHDHFLLMSRGTLSISHPKAVASVKLACHVLLKENSQLPWLITLCRFVTKLMKDYSHTMCTFAAYFSIMSAVLTYGWAFDYSLFVAVIVLFCFLGQTLGLCVLEMWSACKQSNNLRVEKPVALDSYKLFTRSILLGLYSALSTIIFYLLLRSTHVWSDSFHLSSLSLGQVDPITYIVRRNQQRAAVFMQSGVFSLALVYFFRTDMLKRLYGYLSLLLSIVFVLPIMLIGVYANWSFAHFASVGWGWFLAIVIYDIIWLIPFEIWKRIVYRASQYRGLAKVVGWTFKKWQDAKQKFNRLVQRLE